MKYIMKALYLITEWQSPEERGKATILINSICQGPFIISLVVLEEVSSILLPITRMFLTSGIDIIEAMGHVDHFLDLMCKMQSSEKFHKLFECASLLANSLDVTLVKPRTAERSIYRLAAGGAGVSVEDYFRINVYFPTLDNILSDIELRL